MVEEHGNGKQMFRFRAWPKPPATALAVLFVIITLAALAGLDHAWIAAASLGLLASALGFLIYADCAIAMYNWCEAMKRYLRRDSNLHVVRSD